MKNNYISYIIQQGINLQKNQPVEIIGSIYIKEFLEELKKACLIYGASFVIISYTDDKEFQEKLSKGYANYISNEIIKYQKLIEQNFCRIIVKSSFLPSFNFTKEEQQEYRSCVKKIEFVQEYFNLNISQKTICVAANVYWAAKLKLTVDELWEKIISFSMKESRVEEYKDALTKLSIKYLIFKNELGTNLKVGISPNPIFEGKYQYTQKGIAFSPNIPCKEIYTSVNKYDVEGIVCGSKPLYYRDHLFSSYKIEFHKGKIISSIGIESLLKLDSNLSYCGEIALVETMEEPPFFHVLLDENTGCHIALGQSCSKEKNECMNECPYHIDLTFGTNDLNVEAISESGKIIPLMKNGSLIYEK